MSRYTAHLEAIYGSDNACTFDANVVYEDGELHKQKMKMVGKDTYTCQEKPQGGRQSMRQDLIKKFAIVDGIVGRMTYGMATKLATKLVYLKGWKRMAMNKLLDFEGVSEHNFESILRRCPIIRIMASFYEPGMLDGISQEDRNASGLFELDPDMEEFDVSGPACAAGLKLPYAFDATHNKTACRKIILWCTRHGGDLGVGVKYLREACGLKPLGVPDVASGGNATSKAAELGLIQYPEGAADEDNLSKISLFVAKEMNHRGVVILTTSMWGQLSLKGCHTSGLSKPAIGESFIVESFWTDFGAIAKSTH